MKMYAASTIYYSIYYGFRRYQHKSRHMGRRIVAKKLRIPYQNIEIGVYDEDGPMWDFRKTNKLLLWIGKIMLRLRATP